MISDDQLKCYRINYQPEPYARWAAKLGSDAVVPLGAVYAIDALCNEVDRLNARIRELEAAQRPEADDQWDECIDDAISPTMRIEDA